MTGSKRTFHKSSDKTDLVREQAPHTSKPKIDDDEKMTVKMMIMVIIMMVLRMIPCPMKMMMIIMKILAVM